MDRSPGQVRTPRGYARTKRIIDLTICLVAMPLLLPIGLVCAALIRLESPGPILFAQQRTGQHGVRFPMFKFRTMVQNAEELKASLQHLNILPPPDFKIPNDPRVTRVGRFLRKTSLDELPQLLNILKGDMSFVGPRPPLPEEVARYERWQRRRLRMKPGLTCLWALEGRSELSFARWMKLDMDYIDHWSLGLDFKILLRTIPRVLTGRGAS
jgi:lipopolysaccharide/colanic/teichoic acid biosynthesis glycosyltransferase